MPSNASPSVLPDGIEIFRAGRRTADSGDVYEITEADLAASAAAYDAQVHEAPLVVGHPESDLPAYGWVQGLATGAGGVLLSNHRQVEPQFAEMVSAGRFKKRSAAFYHPEDPVNPKPGIWYLKHIAFLGAQPPAVKGLKDIKFNEAEASSAIHFSEPIHSPQEQDDMSKELQDKLDAANAKLKAETDARTKAESERDANASRATAAETKVTNFSEQAKTQRHAAHVSFAEAQVKTGKLLPKDQAATVAVLDALASEKMSEGVQFSEGDTTKKVSPVEFVKGLIEGGAPKVNFGEFAPAGVDQPGAGVAKGKSDAEIDKAAQAYAREHKVNYAEALSAVTTSFTS